ncbi:Wadjet anti-phage system protein JetD domain-containing protein [Clostridium sp. Marseille-QA1073]
MEKVIAAKIIQRYEKSNKSNQNIREGNMSVNFSTFHQYNSDSNFKYRIEINKTANKLQKDGLIKVKWVSEDNIIDRVIFKLSDIEKFYYLAEVDEKKDILKGIVNELELYYGEVKNKNIKNIIEDWKKKVLDKYKIPKIIEDNKRRELILKSLKGIDELLEKDNTMYERVFSKRYLSDSKTFEKHIRTSILSLIRKYFIETCEDLDDDEVLNEVGIEKTTSELHMKGNIQFQLGYKNIDLENFIYGVSLNSQTIRDLQLKNYCFDKVISVENKANFNYLCANEKDALIIFTGGFYTPVQKRFLNRLYEQLLAGNININFYHWGDIDLGGFNIYRNIKKYIFNNLKPYLMNVDVMKKYNCYCEEIDDENYILKLKKLLYDKSIQELHDLIKFVIDNKSTLEQESLIL